MFSNTAARIKQEILNQYVFFHILHTLTGLITWSYYSILLLRTATNPVDAVPLVMQYHGIMFIGLMLGFLLSGKLLSVIGYLNVNRLSNILHLVVSLFTLALLPQITEVYLFVAILLGLARGLHWNMVHMFNTTEIHGSKRERMVSTLYSLEAFFGVALPVLVGAVITQAGYPIVFIVGAALYTVGIVFPWRHNKIIRDSLKWQDVLALSKRKHFARWSAIEMLESVTENLRIMALSVVPFILIGTELGVGALGSLMGLIGAVLAFSFRNKGIRQQVKLGYIGAFVVFMSTAALILFWTLPALVMRGVVSKIGFALHTPAEQYIRYSLREKVIGDFKNEYAAEIQQVAEFYRVIARSINVLMFLVAYYVLGIPIQTILAAMLVVSLLREPVVLFLSSRLDSSIKQGPSSLHVYEYPASTVHKNAGYA